MPASITAAVTLEQLWHRVPGGTAVAALEVAGAIAATGAVHQIGVAAAHRRAPAAAWTPPVAVRHLPLPRLALYEAWHRLRWPAVERATGPVQVIHATAMAVPPRTAPLVVTVHDLAWVHHPGHATARGRRFFEQSLELTLSDADLILCSSEATATDLRRAGAAGERLRVVPLGVRVRTVDPDPEAAAAARHRHGLHRPYVLWVGTVEPRKNLARLVLAYRRLARPDVDLVLVGPRGWNEDLGALVAPVADRVRVLGFVPTDDLDAIYAGASAFCYPSLLEGFGLPVLEAMAHGAPVVTSAGTATAEAAGDAGLLVDPLDVGAITSALATVLEDEAVADRLRAAGPQRCESFTWEQTAAATIDAYREVAS